MSTYYFTYQYCDDEYCDEHTYFFEAASDEEARAQARDFMNESMRYLNLCLCQTDGEESEDDLCLYFACYERKLSEESYTREEAQADLEDD